MQREMVMIKITTLIDNQAEPGKGLEAEHGFSCLAEVGTLRILFDTGTGDSFIRNARALDADLSVLDLLVISHGHYDHAGGVVALLERFSYPALELWTGKGFEYKKYADDPDGMRFLGFDFDRKFLDSHQVSWHTVCTDTVMVRSGVWLVSSFARMHPMERANPRFLVEKPKDGTVTDDFDDEIALVMDSPHGLVMIAGCSHPGILNMVDSVSARFAKPIHMLIGGIHLYDASPERRNLVVHGLIERGIPHLGVSHCTGEAASEMLRASCPGYFANRAGTVTVI